MHAVISETVHRRMARHLVAQARRTRLAQVELADPSDLPSAGDHAERVGVDESSGLQGPGDDGAGSGGAPARRSDCEIAILHMVPFSISQVTCHSRVQVDLFSDCNPHIGTAGTTAD
jgi:hypothetical protein